MAGIQRFEDIEAWKEARILVQSVYRLTDQDGFTKDLGLREQLRRAAVSIMANIAEGFDAGSDSEFIRFLRYALRSGSEVQSHLYVCLDREHMDQTFFGRLCDQTAKVKSLTGGFMRYLRSNRDVRGQ